MSRCGMCGFHHENAAVEVLCQRIAALDAAMDEKTRCLDEAHRALRETHTKLAEAQRERDELELERAGHEEAWKTLVESNARVGRERDALRSRLAHAEQYSTTDAVLEKVAEIARLKVRLARCVADLKQYGKHKTSCPAIIGTYGHVPIPPCTCGFEAALDVRENL